VTTTRKPRHSCLRNAEVQPTTRERVVTSCRPVAVVMQPRRAKASTQASTDVNMADADDASHALGTIALELASARSKLQDAVDRARDLNHVDLPPESTYAHRDAPNSSNDMRFAFSTVC
jgi:hypothetical protein